MSLKVLDKTNRQLLEEIRVLRSRNAKLERIIHEMPDRKYAKPKPKTNGTSLEKHKCHKIEQSRISEHKINPDGKNYFHNKYKMLLVGVGLTTFFWVLESIIHAFIFHDRSFSYRILPHYDHEFLLRLLICFSLIWFSVYAQIIVEKLKMTKFGLQKSRNELEIHVRERAAELAKTNEQLRKEIIERKNAESVLRQHDEFLTSVLDSLEHPFLVINIDDFTIDMINSTAWRGKLAKGAKCYEISHRKVRPCNDLEHPCPLDHIKRTGHPMVVEHIHYDQQGNIRYVEVHGYPLFDEKGKLIKMIEYCLDVTIRKQTELALKENEKRFRATFEQAAVGVAHVAPDGRFIRINQRFCDIAGYSRKEMRERTFQDITHPDDLDADLNYVKQMLAGDISNYSMEKRYVRKDGTFVWINHTVSLLWDDSGEPKFFISVVEDITERRRAQEQARLRQTELLHVSRLNTIGEMASSLAHELNQPLCAILGRSELCLQSVKNGIENREQFNENLETIAMQAELAGNIIRRIRSFIKKQDSHRGSVDINDLVRETLNFIDVDIRHNDIKVNVEFSEHLPKVTADAVQIEQVLINLLRNALEAMTDIDVEKRILTINTSMDSGNSVKVIVHDTGCGLRSEVKEQLFNPFFTTKSKGLGIGLSISHSIIEAHKGEIWVKSNSDCGSTFGFTLPIE